MKFFSYPQKLKEPIYKYILKPFRYVFISYIKHLQVLKQLSYIYKKSNRYW